MTEYATYIDRNRIDGVAQVSIYVIETTPKYKLGEKVADYETSSRGAKASARRTWRTLFAPIPGGLNYDSL